MSILLTGKDVNNQPTSSVWKISDAKNSPKFLSKIKKGEYAPKDYKLSKDEQPVRDMILKHFALGYITMNKPRVEFNDMSVLNRMQIDQMAFNTYQPNNGEGFEGDEINGWKSQAIRPVVRNKCISIAAHATARLIFPKIFAYNEASDEDSKAGITMESLMEWSGERSDYGHTSLYAVITALTDPASIVYTEYAEVFRTVKDVNENGVITEKRILDELFSGFQDRQVPVDELYIENFYEPDIQKQSWLILRRVISYDLAEAKYNKYDNFKKYVQPGVQLVYNDANATFYAVYDTNMRQEDVEEITYWNRQQDLKIIMVNGVMLTQYNNPNPRQDKKYPFTKFGYEFINNRCFYYKSLAFKMQQDANIINTLYPMIIDGTYLNVMPPMVAVGHEAIGSDVIVPGAVTTFSDPNADLRPITTSMNLKTGMETMMKVEESINASTIDPVEQGNQQPGSQTAFEISKMEQNAATILGLFIKSISSFVKQYGTLRLSDILQYMTIMQAKEIGGDSVYQTFLMPSSESGNTKKIKFDSSTPSPSNNGEALDASYDVMKEEGGIGSKTELIKVNPKMFRMLKYHLMVTPDVLNPRSDELERAFNLELYDRAINSQVLDQEQITKDFLLSTSPKSKKDPDKYIAKQGVTTGAPPNTPGMPSPTATPPPPGTQAMKKGMPYQSPIASVMKQKNTQVQAK
jgi:hypothetical protein